MPAAQTTIQLAVGESRELAFKSGAMGGYEWSVTIANEGIIEVEKKGGVVAESNLQPGSNVPELYTITALKKGTAKLHFRQQRIWENEPPRKEEIYIIDIS